MILPFSSTKYPLRQKFYSKDHYAVHWGHGGYPDQNTCADFYFLELKYEKPGMMDIVNCPLLVAEVK